MSGKYRGGLLLAEGQFLLGVNPLLEHNLAVFAFGNVHRARTRFQFVRHFTAHVDADGFGAFADWIRSQNVSPFSQRYFKPLRQATVLFFVPKIAVETS